MDLLISDANILIDVEALVVHDVIDKPAALNAYDKMRRAGRRLPWEQAKERIDNV